MDRRISVENVCQPIPSHQAYVHKPKWQKSKWNKTGQTEHIIIMGSNKIDNYEQVM